MDKATEAEPLGIVLMTRLAAALWIGCGLLVALAAPFLPMGARSDRSLVLLIGLAAVGVGGVVWRLPWHRWSATSMLALIPLALAIIAAFNRAVDDPWIATPFFCVTFAWIGLAHRQGTSLRSTPLLVAAYLVPLAGRWDDPRAVAALFYLVPTCVIIGEASAWVAHRLRRAESARAASEARYAALVGQAAEVLMIFDDEGTIEFVSPASERVLGYAPNELLGRRGGDVVHDADLAVSRTWFSEVREGTPIAPFLCRLRHRDGSLRWMETTLTDLRDDPSVGGLVVNGRDVTERMAAEHRLSHLARHDSLTELPNRDACFAELEQVLVRDARRGRSTAVLFIDLDGFKVVNDSLGHAVGDDFLVAVTARLRTCVRADEYLARLGGDEFVLVAEGLPDDAAACRVAQRVVEALREPITVPGRSHPLAASVGVAVAAPGELDPATALSHADLAMYRAKELGGDRYEMFDETLAHQARRRLDVETELRTAIERGQLVLHYQPELDLITNRIMVMEALVRWQHPTRGLLPPAEFIDVAEQSNLIVELGAFVLAQACRTAAGWHATLGTDAPQVSVNVSARQLADPNFLGLVRAALATNGLAANQLRLEITETLLVDAVAPSALAALKSLGVVIAIDDFGTGYSSLSYLDQLPIDVVKIDRSFLQSVVVGDEPAPVIEAMIAVARSLDLEAVAEGVETPAHLALLDRAGCFRAQGFYFARPLSVGDASTLLLDRALGARRLAAEQDLLARQPVELPPID